MESAACSQVKDLSRHTNGFRETTSDGIHEFVVVTRTDDGKPLPSPDTQRPHKPASRHAWLRRSLAAAWMNALVALVIVGAGALLWWYSSPRPNIQLPVVALKIFTIWCMAFVPCWLYVRFLGQRAGAIWDEYVLNLHRLALDEPRYLPEPPASSQFHREWERDGGAATQDKTRNIYRQKFNAYYGRSVADSAEDHDVRVRVSTDALFPVFLTVVVLSIGWVAVLWDESALVEPRTIWDVLKYGFLGCYVFVAQMLLRRFFASDLRPSAYAASLLRIATTLISVGVACLVLEVWFADFAAHKSAEAVVAFTLGFLPLVAMRFVIKAATAPMRIATRSLESDYPLYQLDGLNVWYEARLAEENIEDMQTLTTANIVDVILHTRVPVGRLIDWIDQSYLYLHQDRVERGQIEQQKARKSLSSPKSAAPPGYSGGDGPKPTDASNPIRREAQQILGSSIRPSSRAGTLTRTALRHLGVRTATDLLKAFPPTRTASAETGTRTAPGEWNHRPHAGLKSEDIEVLARVLSEEQGLAPVWNWYDRGVRARCPIRRPPSFEDCWIAQQRDKTERSSANPACRTNRNPHGVTSAQTTDPSVGDRLGLVGRWWRNASAWSRAARPPGCRSARRCMPLGGVSRPPVPQQASSGDVQL
jgi:hypothetical protein